MSIQALVYRELNKLADGTEFTGLELRRMILRQTLRRPYVASLLRYLRYYRVDQRRVVCIQRQKSLYKIIEGKR